jgi:hypothetical protein
MPYTHKYSHGLPLDLFKNHLNIILLSTSSSSEQSLLFNIPNQTSHFNPSDKSHARSSRLHWYDHFQVRLFIQTAWWASSLFLCNSYILAWWCTFRFQRQVDSKTEANGPIRNASHRPTPFNPSFTPPYINPFTSHLRHFNPEDEKSIFLRNVGT